MGGSGQSVKRWAKSAFYEDVISLGKEILIIWSEIHAIEHIYYIIGYIPCYIADFQNFIEVSSRYDIACYTTCYIASCYSKLLYTI